MARTATALKTVEDKPAPGYVTWAYYVVRIQMVDRLVGGYPKNPDTEAAMLAARGLHDLIPKVQTDDLTDEQKAEVKEQAINKTATGFKRDADGIFLEERNIRALIKECANILKSDKVLGVKNLKSKVAERIYVYPAKIRLGKEPDGQDSRVVHAMTMQGPRSSIKLFDYVEGRELSFALKVMQDGIVKSEMIKEILLYAQENGLGADRSQSAGKFQLLELRKVDKAAFQQVAQCAEIEPVIEL